MSVNKCTIDLEKRQLEVDEKWLTLTVKEKENSPDLIQHSKVQIQSTIKVPAFSELEIMVNRIDIDTEGTWVVESCRASKSEILVACAVVRPGSAGFPKRVWLRNHCFQGSYNCVFLIQQWPLNLNKKKEIYQQ